jgi:hypothetical protein
MMAEPRFRHVPVISPRTVTEKPGLAIETVAPHWYHVSMRVVCRSARTAPWRLHALGVSRSYVPSDFRVRTWPVTPPEVFTSLRSSRFNGVESSLLR